MEAFGGGDVRPGDAVGSGGGGGGGSGGGGGGGGRSSSSNNNNNVSDSRGTVDPIASLEKIETAFAKLLPTRQLDTTDSILGSTSCLTENDAQEAANEMMSAAKELELWFRKQQAFARSQRGVEVKIQTIKMELEEKNALIQATMQDIQVWRDKLSKVRKAQQALLTLSAGGGNDDDHDPHKVDQEPQQETAVLPSTASGSGGGEGDPARPHAVEGATNDDEEEAMDTAYE